MVDAGEPEDQGEQSGSGSPGRSPLHESAKSPSEAEIAERQNHRNAENREKFIYRPARKIGRPIGVCIRLIDDHNGVVTAAATVLIACLTAAIFNVSARQAKSANGQLAVMQGQLDEMRDEQRPWISIEPVEQRGIKWREGTLLIDVVFSIKNVGKSPARKIFFDAEILSDDKFETPKSDEISAFAGKIKIDKLDATTGAFLFPTQAYVETKMLDLDPPKTEFKPLTLYPTILACAEYQFTSGVPKKSCAVFPLYAKQNVIWDAFFPDFDLGVSRGHDVPAPDAKIGAAINTYAD